MDNNSRKAWERRPNETDKSYDAFLAYVKMPIRDIEDDTNSRTLANLSIKLGYKVAQGKAASTLEGWSSKFDWVERARLYDMHKAELSIQVQDASLMQYQEHIIERRTLQTNLLNNALEKQITQTLKEQNAGIPVDPLEILRLVNAAQKLDDLERRLAGLPTNYTTERVDEPDLEAKTFTIGGNSG